MMLWKTIEGIFIATRYGIWGMAILGIPTSTILMIYNISSGFLSMLVCFSALLLSIALVLILTPKRFLKIESLNTKRIFLAVGSMVIALLITGFAYLVVGDFPSIHLIFI